MGSFSIWHILIVAGAALLLFGGKGKISDFMGDFGKGIRSFKKGLVEEDQEESGSRVDPAIDRRAVVPPVSATTLGTQIPAQVADES
jgi:sec-independent protein translocase protein TatA